MLRRKAKAIQRVDASTRKLAADMLETMRDAPGVGLAAPQVGLSIRLVVVEYEDEQYTLINPVITKQSKETAIGEEGCLSLPTVYGDVERSLAVRVEALDLHNKRVTIKAKDWLARIFQHEIDHLDGVLFPDRMAPSAPLRQIRSGAAEEEI